MDWQHWTLLCSVIIVQCQRCWYKMEHAKEINVSFPSILLGSFIHSFIHFYHFIFFWRMKRNTNWTNTNERFLCNKKYIFSLLPCFWLPVESLGKHLNSLLFDAENRIQELSGLEMNAAQVPYSSRASFSSIIGKSIYFSFLFF